MGTFFENISILFEGLWSFIERIYELIMYAGEAVVMFIDGFTYVPEHMLDLISELGPSASGLGAVVVLAVSALILRIIVHLL